MALALACYMRLSVVGWHLLRRVVEACAAQGEGLRLISAPHPLRLVISLTSTWPGNLASQSLVHKKDDKSNLA